MRAGIEVGAWVIGVGSSRPSSGICHQIAAIEGDVLHYKCGISLTEREVLDIVGPQAQGRCLRCSAVLMASRLRSS